MKVELNKAQCTALADLIEISLLDVIRKDPSIDNLSWINAIITAKNVLEQAAAEDKN